MRQNNNTQSQRRSRNNTGNNNRGRGRGGPGKQNYDSNGPGVRIRGSAVQVYDKYAVMARDAATSGDPVLAENLYQHAEHYYRISAEQEAQKEARHSSRDSRGRDRSGKDEKPDNGEVNGNKDSNHSTEETAGPDDEVVVESLQPVKEIKEDVESRVVE